MKKIFLLFLVFYAAAAQGQKLQPYKIDDSVQVSLPKDFKKTDTLGQTILSAVTQFGTIMVIKTPDNPSRTPEIEKLKNLKQYYKDYMNTVQSSSKGTIKDEKDTTIRNLKFKDFSLEIDSGSGKQFRQFRVVHVNSATYAFEFLYQDIHKDYAGNDIKAFFNSIRIPPDAGVASQFTSPENTTGQPPAGNKPLVIAGAIAGGIILIVIIILILRRKRKGPGHHHDHQHDHH